jgi:hypothetical protein
MNISEAMNRVKNYKTENSLEKRGIERDLEIILQRLEKGEYKKGFISANKFDFPTRTQALFSELELLMLLGHDWSRILKVLPIKPSSKIADLCPGFTPKIELGLYYNKFKGKIFIIDKDKASINSLERFVSLFDPAFKTVKVHKDLFHKAVGKYDFVLGNHIIDDLVIYYFAKKAGITLDRFYSEEKTAENLWRNILTNKDKNLLEISKRLADIIGNTVKTGGFLCIAQYKSYSEKILDLTEAFNFNKIVLNTVISLLLGNKFSTRQGIISKAFSGYRGHIRPKDFVLLQKND